MARQESFVRFRGTLGGLTFYFLNGKPVVRTKGGVEKVRILSEDKFERTRENMVEFGGASRVSKVIRAGFSEFAKKMGDSSVAGRLTGILKRISCLGNGLRGRRDIDVVGHRRMLDGFEFNESKHLGSFFLFNVDWISINASSFALKLIDFSSSKHIKAPKGATHFKFYVGGVVVSNYKYNEKVESYLPINAEVDGKGSRAYSELFSVKDPAVRTPNISIDLGLSEAEMQYACIFKVLGIVFYQEADGVLYELKQGKSLRIFG